MKTSLLKITTVWMVVMTTIAPLMAQSLTLDECKQKARDNYPAIRQYGLIDKSAQLNVSNATKSWLPGISVSGFGLGYTDMLDMPPAASALMGDMKNYAYGASVTISQTLYDGGAISAKRKASEAEAQVDAKQLDVNMYAINERVEQLFFGILMIDENLAQCQLLKADLGISEKTVKSLMDGGMANQSDLDAVSVSQVQVEQQEINLRTMRTTYVRMLRYFMGDYEGNGDITLQKPTQAVTATTCTASTARPELLLFASQENLLRANEKQLNARLMPTLSAFAMGAYHNRMMEQLNRGMLMGGVMLKWNVGALYTRKNDLQKLANRRAQIDAQRETFLFNNQLQQRQSNGQIDNLQQQMALDDKVIALRESIREKAEKKVKNGTETVNEYLREVNAVSEARQQRAVHEIQLLQEIYNFRNIVGQ